jgi:hypothetical protein
MEYAISEAMRTEEMLNLRRTRVISPFKNIFSNIFPQSVAHGAIQKFPECFNKNYYVLPGSYSTPSASKQFPWERTHRPQCFCYFWNASRKCFYVRVFSTVCDSARIASTSSNLRPFNLVFISGKRKKSDGTSDNLRKKVCILLKLLSKFPADFQAMLLLFI